MVLEFRKLDRWSLKLENMKDGPFIKKHEIWFQNLFLGTQKMFPKSRKIVREYRKH